MRILRIFTSIPRALVLVLRLKSTLSLVLWPWLVGFVFYLGTTISAIYLYTPLLYQIMHTPQTWWQSVLYFFLQIVLALLLFITSIVISITLVLIFTSVFQTAIAERTLLSLGQTFPQENSSLRGLAKESLRTILVESIKLLWLMPLIVICFMIGLIPILTPIAVIIGSWLLAFQFIDVVLDLYKIPVRKRFTFCIKNFTTVLIFGLSLTLICLVPFLGIFIPPVAVAAASLVLHETGLLERLE